MNSRTAAVAYATGIGRNVMLDLKYSVTQRQAITLKGGKSLALRHFRQGRLVDPEVDRFSDGLPFLASLLLIALGLWIRLRLEETPRAEVPV